MDPFLTVNSKSLILKVQSLGQSFLATSEASGINRVFKKIKGENKNWSLNNHVGIKVPIINNDSMSSAISNSNNSTLVASFDAKDKSIKVFNILKKKLAFKIERHQGEVDHILFDNQNKYLVTGGNDGKVCIWSSSTGKLLYTLPHHNDFVSCLTFSASNKRFASGSYDRTVHIVDLRKMETIAILKLKHKSAIVSISFFSVTYVVTIDRGGSIIVWDYKTSSFLYSLPKTKSEPIYSTVIEDEYLLVACKDSYVYLYSIEKKKLLNMRYIYSNQGIKSISFDYKNSILFISTLSNTINCYDLLQGKDKIKAYVLSHNYADAYSLLAKNPILEEMEPYVKVLFEIWDDTIKEAISHLEDEEKERASRVLSPFLKVPSKVEFIQGLLSEYKEYKQFKRAIDTQNYQLAYSVLKKHPVYKESDYYKKMQDEWDECVKEATLALEVNSEDIDKELKSIFNNFRGISEKLAFIREISSKRTALSLFNKHFKQEAYLECFSMAKEFDFLTDTETYRNLIVKQDAMYIQMKDALKRGLYDHSKTYADELLSFPEHEKEAESILNNIGKITQLIELYNTKNYRAMLNLIQKHPFLEDLPETVDFHDEFQATMELAEAHASQGGVPKIIEIFKPYVQLPQLRERMGKIISSAYIQQMQFLAKKHPDKSSMIVGGLNNYVDIFGIDDAIIGYVSFIKETLGLELLEEDGITVQANYERWTKTNLPARIF